ncbi:MAG: UDP-glucose 6-dehydrogenase, partial [Gammaproteobacteria bacterium]|nr:UDP-glucose 6-dehydrogenase [Gammaproteobacteria bacterium]
GGSCFPKDTLALIRIAQENETPSRIVESVVEVNAAQKARMVKKIRGVLGEVSGKKIAVLGLTFKPETDDMRDSPALSIIPPLLDKGATVVAHDPQGAEEAAKELPVTVVYVDDIYAAVEQADAVVLMTEWNEYRNLDLPRIKQVMRGNAFIDLRNVYERSSLEQLGFTYAAVGR